VGAMVSDGRGVAHLWQKRLSGKFSVWQEGHFIYNFPKNVSMGLVFCQLRRKRKNDSPPAPGSALSRSAFRNAWFVPLLYT